ncbi:unnamed protein product [Didymodactylos carnosus]|uniref:NHL repeat-containing protein n=1 Tax=Didymodactylos carnosus TaxID=1234261 RepID=A0A814I6C2_9BILA|nr:unnamed protein product [Didymodactylos carnosus]CAF1080108.1 unnamed protein product [Didymodactylos carnosus]CAF3790810.1 unnamed protein product [Didymodactylos carnosus]CAF3843244.1 unnamed protein product [Didymodactylos carnosus]
MWLFDSHGNIYVADTGNGRIQLWNAHALFIHSSDNLYICNDNQVLKWTTTENILTIVINKNNTDQEEFICSGLFIDTIGNIYVSDTLNFRIIKFSAKSVNRITVAGGSNWRTAGKNLKYPLGIFVDCFENIYIADRDSNRIQKWTKEAQNDGTVAGGQGQGSSSSPLIDINKGYSVLTANKRKHQTDVRRKGKRRFSPNRRSFCG